MTDRELLEFAAKAAGLDHFTEARKALAKCDEYGPYLVDYAVSTIWSPLQDDGDALRLAVKLGICLEYSHDQMYCWTVHRLGELGKPLETWQEKHDRDPYAATRRAIVRAAAEIGKAQQ